MNARMKITVWIVNIIVLGIFITTLSIRPSGLVFRNPTADPDVVAVGGKIRYRQLSSTFSCLLNPRCDVDLGDAILSYVRSKSHVAI